MFDDPSSGKEQSGRLAQQVTWQWISSSCSGASFIPGLLVRTASRLDPEPQRYFGMFLFTGVVCFRMCIQDTGPRPIRMWWEDLMRGRSEAHFSLNCGEPWWEAQPKAVLLSEGG